MSVTTEFPNPHQPRGRTARSQAIIATLLLVVFALLAGACGSDDGSGDDAASGATKAVIVQALADGTGVSQDTATCIVDKALETHTIEELLAIGSTDADPNLMSRVAEVTTNCILSGDDLAAMLDEPTLPEAELVSSDETAVDSTETGATQPISDVPESPVVEADPRTTTTDDFCSTSRRAYESYVVLDLLATNAEPAAMRQILTELQVDIAQALVVAPNLELAQGPEVALDALDRIVQVARLNGFSEELLTNNAGPSFDADLETFASVMSDLERYLAGPCGYDEAAAKGSAAQRAADLEATSTQADTANAVYINDTTTGISVLVPAAWSDTMTEVDNGGRSLLVAPDAGRYNSSWDGDGVAITALELDGTTNLDWPSIMAETAAWNECTPSSDGTYDDGTYRGTVHALKDCGGTQASTVVIAAANADNTQLLLVQIQMVDMDKVTVDMIIGSVDI